MSRLSFWKTERPLAIAIIIAAAALSFSKAHGDEGSVSPGMNTGKVASDLNTPAASEKPKQIEGVGIQEKLGHDLDLSLTFKDEEGKDIRLSDIINGSRPVIISPVYFSCPGLCNFHLNGLVEGLKEVDWNIGQKFDVIALSFDSKENYELAQKKKANYLKVYGRQGVEKGFHFLTGDEANIQKLTQAVGFGFKWNDETKEWAHASAAIVSSPKGKITRYLPGIQFFGKDIKLALTEAGEGKVGTFVDQLVLYCFQYNPHQGKFTLYALNIMKLGAALMVIILGIWLVPVFIRSRREQNG